MRALPRGQTSLTSKLGLDGGDTFLKTEQTKLADAKQQLEQQQMQNQRGRDLVAALRQNTAVSAKLQSLSGLSDPKESRDADGVL